MRTVSPNATIRWREPESPAPVSDSECPQRGDGSTPRPVVVTIDHSATCAALSAMV
jgi:hypothetical protein